MEDLFDVQVTRNQGIKLDYGLAPLPVNILWLLLYISETPLSCRLNLQRYSFEELTTLPTQTCLFSGKNSMDGAGRSWCTVPACRITSPGNAGFIKYIGQP